MYEKERRLVFLAKCAICILLVCVALQWRPQGAPLSAARHGAPASEGGFARQAMGAANSLMRGGVEAFADATREKCLAAPRECLSAAQRLQPATRAR